MKKVNEFKKFLDENIDKLKEVLVNKIGRAHV